MKETANIVKSLKQLFAVNAALTGAIPGGLIYQTAQEGIPRPYATLNVELGETEFQSGATYIQDYNVKVLVWGGDALGDAGTIQAILETWLGYFTKLPALSATARTLQIIQVPAAVDYDKDRKAGKHVLMAGQAWTISLQEQRSLYSPVGSGD